MFVGVVPRAYKAEENGEGVRIHTKVPKLEVGDGLHKGESAGYVCQSTFRKRDQGSKKDEAG